MAGSFYLRQLAGQMRTLANPQQLFYETHKIRVRASRLLEGVERAVGTRSGPGIQVELRGVQELTDAIGSAGRRNAIGFAAATAIVGTALTANARNPRTWLTAAFGTAARGPDRRPAGRRDQAALNAAWLPRRRAGSPQHPSASSGPAAARDTQRPHVLRGHHPRTAHPRDAPPR